MAVVFRNNDWCCCCWFWGHADVVSLLILCPSLAIDARNNVGVTALMKAALQGRVRCTRLLLLAGKNRIHLYPFVIALSSLVSCKTWRNKFPNGFFFFAGYLRIPRYSWDSCVFSWNSFRMERFALPNASVAGALHLLLRPIQKIRLVFRDSLRDSLGNSPDSLPSNFNSFPASSAAKWVNSSSSSDAFSDAFFDASNLFNPTRLFFFGTSSTFHQSVFTDEFPSCPTGNRTTINDRQLQS